MPGYSRSQTTLFDRIALTRTLVLLGADPLQLDKASDDTLRRWFYRVPIKP